jgi:hypothetical protein
LLSLSLYIYISRLFRRHMHMVARKSSSSCACSPCCWSVDAPVLWKQPPVCSMMTSTSLQQRPNTRDTRSNQNRQAAERRTWRTQEIDATMVGNLLLLKRSMDMGVDRLFNMQLIIDEHAFDCHCSLSHRSKTLKSLIAVLSVWWLHPPCRRFFVEAQMNHNIHKLLIIHSRWKHIQGPHRAVAVVTAYMVFG